MSCEHPPSAIRCVDNAVYDGVPMDGVANENAESKPPPVLLWCSACGALAWTDGSYVAIMGVALGVLGQAPAPEHAAWVRPSGTQ
jgi:hypothetical protein